MDLSSVAIEDALSRVGQRLYADDAACSIVVAGGAALSLRGIIERSTSDVDVIAWQRASQELIKPPAPLPRALQLAVEAVGRELNLGEAWFDLRVAEEWEVGLPAGFASRVEWRTYGRGLTVGLAGRLDLIYFKLVAAADDQHPRHLQDLLRLAPTPSELDTALTAARSSNVGLNADLERVGRLCLEAYHA